MKNQTKPKLILFIITSGADILWKYIVVKLRELREHILCVFQARHVIQAEARKHGLQHNLGLGARNPGVIACEQEWRRQDCASAQSDQRLCYSLSEKQINQDGYPVCWASTW